MNSHGKENATMHYFLIQWINKYRIFVPIRSACFPFNVGHRSLTRASARLRQIVYPHLPFGFSVLDYNSLDCAH
jgi:hypothetical protein